MFLVFDFAAQEKNFLFCFCFNNRKQQHTKKMAEQDTFKLVLVRHGESLWNKENKFTGWADVPLSDKGREEAKAAAEVFFFFSLSPFFFFFFFFFFFLTLFFSSNSRATATPSMSVTPLC